MLGRKLDLLAIRIKYLNEILKKGEGEKEYALGNVSSYHIYVVQRSSFHLTGLKNRQSNQ